MNTISYPQTGGPDSGRISEEKIQEAVYPYHHEVNITDGGEFLDDAIRTKDQPFEETLVKENEAPLSK